MESIRLRLPRWISRDTYADGGHRPLCRGWLHGMTAITSLRMVAYGWRDLKGLPVVLSIVFNSTASAALHLYPFRSIDAHNASALVDRLAIIGTGISNNVVVVQSWTELGFARCLWIATLLFFSLRRLMVVFERGQMLSADVIHLCTVHVLYRITFEFMLGGSRNIMTVQPALLYSIGGLFYITKYPGPNARWWGYHEWMHVAVTIAWVLNVYCVQIDAFVR